MNRFANAMLTAATLALIVSLPAMAADNLNTHQGKGVWPSETLTGTIDMVEAGNKVLVIKSGKVPFDMIITPKTRITHGSQAVEIKDLSQFQNKSVSVRFTPEARGDIAQSIQING